jgi:methylated-DNA-[protein]-cysteine S-methyltransferase
MSPRLNADAALPASPRRPCEPAGCVAQAVAASPLGDLRLACTPLGLAGLWFVGQHDDPGDAVAPRAGHRWLDLATEELHRYWTRASAGGPRFSVPLDLQGTPFQRAVWQALLQVPEGRTDSYARLAARAGHPGAVRAVGAAVGRNPVSVIVPCHRIVASDGRLTGFGGGLPRKVALLSLEGVLPAGLLSGIGGGAPAWAPGGQAETAEPADGAAPRAGDLPGSPPAAAEAKAHGSRRWLARLRVPRGTGWPGPLATTTERGPGARATAASRATAAQPSATALQPAAPPAQAELPWAAEGPAA